MQEITKDWGLCLSNQILFDSCPSLNIAAMQTTDSPDYYWPGKGRGDYEHYIIQLTLKGQGYFEKHGTHTKVPKGNGFILFSHDETAAYGYPENGTEPWQFLFLDFHGGGAMVDQIISTYGHVFSFNPEAEIIQRIMNLRFRRQTAMGFAESSSLVAAVIASIVETEEGIQTERRYNRIISSAVEIINNNLEQGLYVKELAEVLKITPEYLSRLFRKETGNTLLDYMRRQRMAHAAKLLVSSRQSVKEIADRMGYDTSANFARTFKKVYGQSPAQYRAS